MEAKQRVANYVRQVSNNTPQQPHGMETPNNDLDQFPRLSSNDTAHPNTQAVIHPNSLYTSQQTYSHKVVSSSGPPTAHTRPDGYTLCYKATPPITMTAPGNTLNIRQYYSRFKPDAVEGTRSIPEYRNPASSSEYISRNADNPRVSGQPTTTADKFVAFIEMVEQMILVAKRDPTYMFDKESMVLVLQTIFERTTT